MFYSWPLGSTKPKLTLTENKSVIVLYSSRPCHRTNINRNRQRRRRRHSRQQRHRRHGCRRTCRTTSHGISDDPHHPPPSSMHRRQGGPLPAFTRPQTRPSHSLRGSSTSELQSSTFRARENPYNQPHAVQIDAAYQPDRYTPPAPPPPPHKRTKIIARFSVSFIALFSVLTFVAFLSPSLLSPKLKLYNKIL
jgi:hypothetical protein